MPSSPPAQPWETIVPFHKLTQWLAYSLMTPMSKLMHIQFAGTELLTGLPEYRNGGLLIDTGLLTLKKEDMDRGLRAYRDNAQKEGQPNVEVVPLFETSDDVIVEWRAVTVGFLDMLLGEVNSLLGLDRKDGLTLAQMLEGGTWKVCLRHIWVSLSAPSPVMLGPKRGLSMSLISTRFPGIAFGFTIRADEMADMCRIGWSGTCGSFATEYQGAAHYDCVRRYRLLRPSRSVRSQNSQFSRKQFTLMGESSGVWPVRYPWHGHHGWTSGTKFQGGILCMQSMIACGWVSE